MMLVRLSDREASNYMLQSEAWKTQTEREYSMYLVTCFRRINPGDLSIFGQTALASQSVSVRSTTRWTWSADNKEGADEDRGQWTVEWVF